jgi:asparagine synthase (glutamine-hydrolysing)
LPAGHKLTLKNNKLEIKPFWQAADHAKENFSLGLEEWKKELWELFKDSVKKRMISDVPVGAFLSGGLDSSSVVAAMSEITGAKIKTFAVGFKDRPDSETPFAKIVADRYQTDHTEIIIEPDILESLPKLIYHYEEPFFDNSAIPTMAMAQETKKHVTVVLTGDGGDECFGGYPSYAVFKYLSWYHKLPEFIYRSAIPKTLGALAGLSNSKKLAKLHYRSELLSHPLMQAYVDYYGIWQKELGVSKFYITKHDLYTEDFRKIIDIDLSDKLMSKWMAFGKVKDYGHMNRAMLADIASRLGDNYLVKVDIAGMIYALESRPPFLDHRLVEASLSLPEKYKIKGGAVKWIWKEIMKDKLPEAIISRRKMGFGIPIISWMRNEIYEYLRGELLSDNGTLYNYLDKKTVERLLMDHKEGKADYSNHIWSILLLKQWLGMFFK